ncbi:hypothetical protein PRUB_a3734 [Pseudoalteromonas rubra]|uniref:Uncharacterized protein n=1 Tax=Pseudoalteromonas rubra TaxID=43658 RepID=A0A8T0C8A9_9GAMM|nr:hypothetical protein PRUB_a3734 [Pseudoalteromonas rubra]
MAHLSDLFYVLRRDDYTIHPQSESVPPLLVGSVIASLLTCRLQVMTRQVNLKK